MPRVGGGSLSPMVSGEAQRMIVTCPECAARYKLDRSRVSARGARITCPRCKHVFVVYPSQQSPGSTTLTPTGFQDEPGPSKSVPAPRPSVPTARAPEPARKSTPAKSRRKASDLDFRKVGIGSWKVRVKIGLVYDFSDIRTLRKYIADGRVTPEDVISHDGSTWVPIGDIPDLDAYFVEVYERAEAGAQAAPEPTPTPSAPTFDHAFEEDDPTRIMRVGGGLGSNLAAQTLAAAAAEAAQAEAAPATGARPFVDPFAQLKEEKRRRPAAKRAPAPAEAPKSKALPIVAGVMVLVVIGLGAWWFLTQEDNGVVLPTQEPANTAEMDEARKNAASELEKLDEELRKDLERSKAEEAERADRDKLTPVGPKGPGPGLRPVVPDKIPTQSNDPIATDYAAMCKAAAGRSDWSAALSPCGSAAQSNGRDLGAKVSYGIALFETGKADSAKTQLQQAKSMGSRDARVEKYLGHIARKQGDVFGANAHYQAYLATKPRDAAAIQALMQGG